MRRVRYHVAVSLDGFIATPEGGYDWLLNDDAIDFVAIFRQFDTAVMGRKTYDVVRAQAGGLEMMQGMDCVVFSRTLPASSQPGWRVVNDDPGPFVKALKQEKGRGKDIWLFGGGEMFRTLLDVGVVDTVELAVMPILLGAGLPVLPPGEMAKLTLTDHRVLPSGIIFVAYALPGAVGPAPRITYVKKTRKPLTRATRNTRNTRNLQMRKTRKASPKKRAPRRAKKK